MSIRHHDADGADRHRRPARSECVRPAGLDCARAPVRACGAVPTRAVFDADTSAGNVAMDAPCRHSRTPYCVDVSHHDGWRGRRRRKWLRNKHWAPWDRASLGKDASNDSSFWNCTSRHASLFSLYRRWLSVLVSALRYSSQRAAAAARMRAPLRVALSMVVSVNVLALTVLTATMLGVSLVEVGLLMAFDYAWWRQRALRSAIIARYDTVHFGREELQLMFEYSEQIRSSLRAIDGVDACALHNRVMGAVVTTAAVLENAFRRAYLVTPVYEVAMSNRRALRDRYAYVGCDLDMLIKQVRLILEHKHTSGLMSIASTSGTIEASLHNNIESILSVAIFFEPLVLYNVTSRVAALEAAVERRLSKGKKAP
eukprot:IDg16360t1